MSDLTISCDESNATQRGVMSGLTAVLITLAIIIPCLLVGFFNFDAAEKLGAAVIIGTAAWTALDSSRLNVRAYQSQLAVTPFVLFTACLGMWIVIFPVYLVVRSKVAAGMLPEGPNPHARRAFHLCVAVWCLMAVLFAALYIMANILSGRFGLVRP